MGIAVMTVERVWWEVSAERPTRNCRKTDKYWKLLGIKYCSSFKVKLQRTVKEIPIITSNYKEVW